MPAKRVLVVDDSKAMRMIVRRTLRQTGIPTEAIEEATNGVEAMTAIVANPPDVVISDWNMPDMSGIDLLEALNAKGVKVRFGFVTSESTEDMKSRATAAGANFFIIKPFTPEVFERALRPVLDS